MCFRKIDFYNNLLKKSFETHNTEELLINATK